MEEDIITIPCTCAVHEGDRVIIALDDGEPTVIGVVGWGDSVQDGINNANASIGDLNNYTLNATTDLNGGLVASITTKPSSTSADINSVRFISAAGISSEVPAYTITYDGEEWMHEGEAVSLNEYGITLTWALTYGGETHSGGLTVSIDSDIFMGNVDAARVYTFRYNGAEWFLDESAVTLSEYGITASGQTEGSSISVTVTTASPITGNFIVVTVAETLGRIAQIQQDIALDIAGIYQNLDKYDEYIDMEDDTITLHSKRGTETQNAVFETKLSSERLSFLYGEADAEDPSEVAYISGKELYINNATINEEQQQGGFKWIKRSVSDGEGNGSYALTLKWVG